jgi:hypothetical protein
MVEQGAGGAGAPPGDTKTPRQELADCEKPDRLSLGSEWPDAPQGVEA